MDLQLHSQRLALTPFSTAELDLCLEMFTDPEVTRYAGGSMTRTEVENAMADWIKRGANGCIGIWCISDKGTGEKYGSIALLPMPIEEDDTDFSLVTPDNLPEGNIEIGYFLKRLAWGRGYATEACRRLLDFVFQESPLTEVVATFDDENIASRNVLTKAGFVDHGRMRSYGEDGPIFRITRADWSDSYVPNSALPFFQK